jgi:hypothetical protein
MAVRIVEQGRIVRGAQSAGNLLCKYVDVYGSCHRSEVESAETICSSCVVLVSEYEIGEARVSADQACSSL